MRIILLLIFPVCLLAAAWHYDKRSWRRKSREKLVGILRSGNWRCYRAAIQELRRRGEAVSVYRPRVVALLASPVSIERIAAQIIIGDCFPESATELLASSPAAGLAEPGGKALRLLARFVLS